jgi:hypothetical protein
MAMVGAINCRNELANPLFTAYPQTGSRERNGGLPVVKKPRKRASAPELKQRIMDRASSDPENLRLAQARDLAALHLSLPQIRSGRTDGGVHRV